MYPDGTVAVVDRSKDIIISGGEVYIMISFSTPVKHHLTMYVKYRMPPALPLNKVSGK